MKGLVCLPLILLAACNSDVPVSASVEFASDQIRLTITRVATHPFLSRHDLRLTFRGPGPCSGETELFPNTGHVSRRNLYQTRAGCSMWWVSSMPGSLIPYTVPSRSLNSVPSIDT